MNVIYLIQDKNFYVYIMFDLKQNGFKIWQALNCNIQYDKAINYKLVWQESLSDNTHDWQNSGNVVNKHMRIQPLILIHCNSNLNYKICLILYYKGIDNNNSIKEIIEQFDMIHFLLWYVYHNIIYTFLILNLANPSLMRGYASSLKQCSW